MPVIFDQVIGKVDTPPPPAPPEAAEENTPPATAVRQKILQIFQRQEKRKARLTAD